MSPPKKDDKEITVEAELVVSTTYREDPPHQGIYYGEHVVRRFDRAWILALEKARIERPVKISRRGFVRKED